jgi:hypothetical protein
LVSAQERRRHDKALPKDETEVVSSSWLNEKEVGYDTAVAAEGEVAPGRGKGIDDASWVDADLNGPKNKENPHDRFNYYK